MSVSKLALKLSWNNVLVNSTSIALNKMNNQQKKNFSVSHVQFIKLAQKKKPDLNKAVSEAEKIVGYPTSFLNLRWLLSDEIENVTSYVRKLAGCNHPLLETAKSLIYNDKSNMQAWGLIVLLISRAAGFSPDVPELEQDKTAGILNSQRALAEVVEMIRTSNLIHKSLVNLQSHEEVDPTGDILIGNKIALLSGDYLLSNSCVEMAKLRNSELVELLSSTVRDLAEAEFVGLRDKQNNPLPSKPIPDHVEYKQFIDNSFEPLVVSEALGNAQAEWTLRHVLSTGSLLGKSCQCALKLAGHPEEFQGKGYIFGKNFALAWQANLEQEIFTHDSTGQFSLISAPVFFTLQHDPSLYRLIEEGQECVDDIDYDTLRKAVVEGPGLEMTKALQREHSKDALEILTELPMTDARKALENIIVAMEED